MTLKGCSFQFILSSGYSGVVTRQNEKLALLLLMYRIFHMSVDAPAYEYKINPDAPEKEPYDRYINTHPREKTISYIHMRM